MGVELAVAGLALAAIGTGVQVYGATQAKEANDERTAAERRAEALRAQQMRLDAERRRREVIRQSVIARANAETTTTNQGAGIGSALPGAFGSISGRTGVNTLGINQNEQIGEGLFAANADVLTASQHAASAQMTSSIGAGMSSLGGAVMSNATQIVKVGGWANASLKSGMSFGTGPGAWGSNYGE